MLYWRQHVARPLHLVTNLDAILIFCQIFWQAEKWDIYFKDFRQMLYSNRLSIKKRFTKDFFKLTG